MKKSSENRMTDEQIAALAADEIAEIIIRLVAELELRIMETVR